MEDLIKLGWRRRVGTLRPSFLRPDASVVRRRRDLSQSENDRFGDVLFPGRKKPRPEVQSQPLPAQQPEPLVVPDPQPQPEGAASLPLQQGTAETGQVYMEVEIETEVGIKCNSPNKSN